MSTLSPALSAAGFDADAIAIAPPELRIGGKVYRGRVLSIIEWSGFLERFLAASEQEFTDVSSKGVVGSKTMLANHAFCVEYLRFVLDLPPMKRGGRKGSPDPVRLLERQGSRLVKQVFAHFFGHQCYVQGVALRTPTDAARELAAAAPTHGAPKTEGGTSSSDSTIRAPSDGAAPS